MRVLTLSLIAAVLAATIGLGRLVDTVFYYVVPNSSGLNSDSVMVLEQIGQELADSLNSQQQPGAFLANWPSEGRFQLSLVPLSDIHLPASLIQQVSAGEPLLLTNNDELSLYFYLDQHQTLLLLKPTDASYQPESSNIKLLLTLLFYSALVILIWLWTYPLVSRLITLRRSAQLFGKGQLDQRIKVGSVSYVKDLEREFNHMAQRIQNLVSDVKLLSSAVSHDLRTPLARMRFGIDTLAEEQNPRQQAIYLERLGHDVDDMTQLVEILLDYARLEQTMMTISKQSVDLTELVQHCIKLHNYTAQRIRFEGGNEPCQVTGDRKYLRILVNNLLQNALRYGRQDIVVTLQQQAQHICLVIADDGEGFSEDSTQLLKPFVRGKTAADKAKGYGMGLAIVQRIVDWHNAQLVITRSEQLGGAELKVVFCKH